MLNSGLGYETRFQQKQSIAHLIGVDEIAYCRELVEQQRIVVEPKFGITIVQAESKKRLRACPFQKITLPLLVTSSGEQRMIIQRNRNLDESIFEPALVKA